MILCLGGGTPHKPAITVNGHVLHEAVACADFLLEKVACSGPYSHTLQSLTRACSEIRVVCFMIASHASWLTMQGIRAERILKETASYDTVGNGYFATTIHALPAQWR